MGRVLLAATGTPAVWREGVGAFKAGWDFHPNPTTQEMTSNQNTKTRPPRVSMVSIYSGLQLSIGASKETGSLDGTNPLVCWGALPVPRVS